MGGAEFGRVAAEDARRTAKPERGDVFAQQRTRLGGVVDEQRKRRAARKRFNPERAGAGEKIEHARAMDRIVVGVREDIKQCFAQPVSSRPDRLRLRCGERASAQVAADNPHQRPRGRGGRDGRGPDARSDQARRRR